MSAAGEKMQVRECTFSVPPNESERLEALHSIGILDTPPQDMFDRITSILARVLEVPICLVSLVDTDRQWFKSNLGLGDTFETHRNEAFCGHAIMPGAPEVLVVHDTVLDSRFRDNLLVTGPPFIRFYAGAPIRYLYNNKVYKLGTVCAIDRKPRNVFTVKDKQILVDMAAVAADEIRLFRRGTSRVMEENQRYITSTAHDLKTPLTVFRLANTLFKEHFKGQSSLPPSELLDIADQAEIACEMMHETVCNAIDSARARWVRSPGHSVAKLEALNLASAIEMCCRLNKHHCEDVTVKVDIGSHVPKFLLSDPHLFQRTLVNFMTNAFKFAGLRNTDVKSVRNSSSADEGKSASRVHGEILIKCSIKCRAPNESGSWNILNSIEDDTSSSAGDSTSRNKTASKTKVTMPFLRTEVHDNGPGVPTNLHARIFKEAFVSSKDSSASDVASEPMTAADFADKQGSGLGLFMSALCVKDMGGSCGFRDIMTAALDAEAAKTGSAALSSGATMFAKTIAGVTDTSYLDPPEPRLGGSVFYFDIPIQVGGTESEVTAARAAMEAEVSVSDDEQKRDINGSGSWCKACNLSDEDLLKGVAVDHDTSLEKQIKTSGVSSSSPSTSSSSFAVEMSEAPKESNPGCEGRVLVVDDSIMVQKLLCHALTQMNFDVDTAKNGREAVEQMQRMTYRVVLMDFLMPVLDGISATALFRQWEQNREEGLSSRQFIIGISANAEEHDLAAARSAGIDHFISKPVHVNEVVRFIHKYCKLIETDDDEQTGGDPKRRKLTAQKV